MLINRPFPGLFGGVSEQVPALRDPSQCEALDNAYVSLSDGLCKRPGTAFLTDFTYAGVNYSSGQGDNVATHVIDQGDGNRFLVVIASGGVRVFNMETGAEHTVTVSSAAASYLTTANNPVDIIRTVTAADTTFIVNREIGVVINNAGSANAVHVNYARVVSAQLNVEYRMTVDGVTGTYTPTTATDVTTRYIAQQLATNLGTALGGGYSIMVQGSDVIEVSRTSLAASTLVCEDGWGNQALINLSQPLRSSTYLSPQGFGPLTITIDESGTGDAVYYVKWDGTRKQWVETVKPAAIPSTFVMTSMPVTMTRTGTTTWSVLAGSDVGGPAWASRTVGDEDSNPTPSFNLKYLDDVFFYRNRLGFLSGDSVVLSRAGSFYNFWSESARDVFDTDPIDVTPASADLVTFNYAIPFNDKLVIFTENSQWTLEGGDLLSPKSVKLAVSTRYEASTKCRPLLVGGELYFTSNASGGQPARLFRYSIRDSGEGNYADDLSSHVPNYIHSLPRNLSASSTQKLLLLTNRQTASQVAVFKWETDGEKFIQRAWGKWKMPTGPGHLVYTLHTHIAGTKVYFLIYRHYTATNAKVGRYSIEVLDLRDVRASTGPGDAPAFSEYCADRKIEWTETGVYDAGNNWTEFTIPYDADVTGSAFTWSVGGAIPTGLLSYTATLKAIEADGNGNPRTDTKLRITGDWSGVSRSVSFGVNYDLLYRFSQVNVADNQGNPIPSMRVRLKRYVLRYENSGYFKVEVTPYKRSAYTYVMNGYTVGSNAVNQSGVATGHLIVPVGTNPEGLTVDVKSDNPLHVRIPYAEWTAAIAPQSRR